MDSYLFTECSMCISGVQGSKFDPGSVAGFIRVWIFTGVGFIPGFGLEL